MSDRTRQQRTSRAARGLRPWAMARTACALFAAALASAAAAAPSQVQVPAAERGRALYEARCEQCHDRGVHQRASRTAKSFAELRASVVRWDRQLGALWRADELDAVTRYLNDRYYRYPCPDSVCRSDRAESDRPQGTNLVR